MVYGGYLKVKNSLYTRVIIWVNTILNYLDTRTILPRYERSYMVFKPKWYRKQKHLQIHVPSYHQKLQNPHFS